MPDKWKKRFVFHVSTLKKWYEATCFWTADDTGSKEEEEEEKVVPSWQGESNVALSIGA